MIPWTRKDTQAWIFQVHRRLDDIQYYLRRTIDWCDRTNVYQDEILFSCSIMTAVWVSHMRNEHITKHELFEILGIADWDKFGDDMYELSDKYQDMDHEEMLQSVVNSFRQ